MEFSNNGTITFHISFIPIQIKINCHNNSFNINCCIEIQSFCTSSHRFNMRRYLFINTFTWTTTAETGIRRKMEENLPCRIHNIGKLKNRNDILRKCPVYERIRPNMLEHKEWIETIRTNTRNKYEN